MGMTRVQAKELGKYGINVNAIAPGSIIMTDMYAAVPEEVKQAKLAKIPLRRYGDPARLPSCMPSLLPLTRPRMSLRRPSPSTVDSTGSGGLILCLQRVH